MKRFLLLAVCIVPGLITQAQPTAGKILAGGFLGVTTYADKSKSGGTTNTNSVNTYVQLLPAAGYFLTDRLAVGASLGLEGTILKNPGSTVEKTTEMKFLFGPFARYYLISGTAGIYAEGSFTAGIGKHKLTYETTTYEENLMSFGIGIKPGAYFYVTPKVAVEATVGWMGFSTEVLKDPDDNKEITNAFGFTLIPGQVSVGITILL
jgi:hypothetical protein